MYLCRHRQLFKKSSRVAILWVAECTCGRQFRPGRTYIFPFLDELFDTYFKVHRAKPLSLLLLSTTTYTNVKLGEKFFFRNQLCEANSNGIVYRIHVNVDDKFTYLITIFNHLYEPLALVD